MLNILSRKVFKEKLEDNFEKQFNEITKKTAECHNVSILTSIKSEIQVLESIMLNKITEEEQKLVIETPTRVGSPAMGEITPRIGVKKHKSISIKDVDTGHSWRIETVEDVDKYIAQLRDKLLQELKKEENTILNILL